MRKTSKKKTYPWARLQLSDTGMSADPAEEPWGLKGIMLAAKEGSGTNG